MAQSQRWPRHQRVTTVLSVSAPKSGLRAVSRAPTEPTFLVALPSVQGDPDGGTDMSPRTHSSSPASLLSRACHRAWPRGAPNPRLLGPWQTWRRQGCPPIPTPPVLQQPGQWVERPQTPLSLPGRDEAAPWGPKSSPWGGGRGRGPTSMKGETKVHPPLSCLPHLLTSAASK